MKNNPEKQRKVAVQYVELCGAKQGRPSKTCDNRILTLDEIAQQLGTNKRTLQELLEIERKRVLFKKPPSYFLFKRLDYTRGINLLPLNLSSTQGKIKYLRLPEPAGNAGF